MDCEAIKKGELMFGPEAHEIKDKYWTQDRAARVVNSDNLNPLGHKSFVIDGRLKGQPVEGKTFSLYWVIERDADAAKQNLATHVVQPTFDMAFQLPSKTAKLHMEPEKLPQIPILYNEKAIPKHTRLVASEDGELKALAKQITASLLKSKVEKEKKKKDEDQKKKTEKDTAAGSESSSAKGKAKGKETGKGKKNDEDEAKAVDEGGW